MLCCLTIHLLSRASGLLIYLVAMNPIICYHSLVTIDLLRDICIKTQIIKQDFLQDKMMAKAKLVNSPFVYKVHFNDNLSTWNENHFSLRLVNCLMKYPVVPGTVAEYTAREGQLFDQLEDAKYFIFHGSPDIILRRVGVDKNVVVVNEGQEEDGDDQLEEQDEQDLDGNRDQMAAVLKHF